MVSHGQAELITCNAMEVLKKTVRVASDTTVISEGYDLILSHCITRGLNYII